MQNIVKSEKKMGTKIEKPSGLFISWKTVVPALAALGVGGFFFRGRKETKPSKLSGPRKN